LSLAAPRALPAQFNTTLDASASVVRYDGFLTSGAASVAPALRYETPRLSLLARGSAVLFESGNTSAQGQLAASAFSSPLDGARLEIGAELAASRYESFATYASALARGRVHLIGRASGAWAGLTFGQSIQAAEGRPARELSAGAWARRGAAAVSASFAAVGVGDTSYADLLARGHWVSALVELDVGAGARVGGSGGGEGVFAEGGATVWLSRTLALVLNGGRYPSDPVRGNVGGRYVSFGARVSARPRQVVNWAALPLSRPPLRPWTGTDGGVETAAESRLELRTYADGVVELRLRAAMARSVEVMGDFSGWQPVACERRRGGLWFLALRLDPGVYRFNVRVDEGRWDVPAGVARVEDEFGGLAGTLVVR
jgi:hypothetical protein